MTQHPRDPYAQHFAAILEADVECRAAKAKHQMARNAMRKLAIEEARASLVPLGVELGKTVLTLKGRWEYQDRPVIVMYLTCWSTPLETAESWCFQAHWARAKKNGQPYADGIADYEIAVCAHPREAGAAILRRLPIWGTAPKNEERMPR